MAAIQQVMYLGVGLAALVADGLLEGAPFALLAVPARTKQDIPTVLIPWSRDCA